METKEILANARESMLTQLIDLAAEGRRSHEAERFRDRARKLIQEIGVAERALQSISPGPSNKYGGFKRAIEAILAYLNEIGRPVTEQEIIDELCNGGFRGSAPGTGLVISKSIKIYLYGIGRKTVAKHPELGIKLLNGKIGRADWPKERFK